MKHEDGVEDFLQVADRELYQRLEERRNKVVDDVILKAMKTMGTIQRTAHQAAEALGLDEGELNKVLDSMYAQRGEPSREHTLVFHGTPDEFAFFKARPDEWAKKRISI